MRLVIQMIYTMCTVSINVNDAVMRQINPTLTNRECIKQWLQHQVDMMIARMVEEDDETMDLEISNDMTIEELYDAIEQDVKNIYADGAL